jgi:hypothetical protein
VGAIKVVEPDIAKGRALIRALESQGLTPKAALWLSEDSIWRLILQIPKLEELSLAAGYRRVQQVIKTSPGSFPELSDITLAYSDLPLLKVLRRAISVSGASDDARIRLTRNNFDGTFIEDAIVYRL